MPVIPPTEAHRGQLLVARDDHDSHDLTDMFQTDSHVIQIVGGSTQLQVWNNYQETERIREKERKRREQYDAERAQRVNAEVERRRKALRDVPPLGPQDQDLVEQQRRKLFDELDAEYERLEKIKQEKAQQQQQQRRN